MTPWQWWVGYDEDGAPESYGDNFGTRGEAIAAGEMMTSPGETFWIIEARSSEAVCYEGADIIPFLRTRNRERIANDAPNPIGDNQ